MILNLKEEHKAHLSLLFKQPVNVLQDFCKLALEYLVRGSKPKLYSSAAQKLEVEPDDIENAVEGIVFLLIESSKNKLNELDFRDTLLTVGFSEEQQAVLSELYKSKEKELNEVLPSSSLHLPHFKNLEWRFECQVSSRSVAKQLTPKVTLNLTLTGDKEPSNILLQADPKNLQHMTGVLEKALKEARSQNSRRLQRRLKIS
ncbi:COMM domain-containing protein 2-like [Nilaparvata lugens]|uniref:COMM domain-containing protein 2-like n=1 Tax=Nilaparvata lugens TaxID=108931 RepID=UPI00193D75D5|nr:COMM domain-containing protein 2-like [Nilaparvata lugens]